MSKILEVKNLKISFKTNNGNVQAVRDISFSLAPGETLAIVGESGSGKSVTSRAILGILAGNSIVENGEIIFEGKDLLKISEKDFQSIRGDQMAMIFQDPLSSLNPIVRIGKQLTEAMIYKNRRKRRENKKFLNKKTELLIRTLHFKKNPEIEKRFAAYKEIISVAGKLEASYDIALEYRGYAIKELNYLKIDIEKNSSKLKDIKNRWVYLKELIYNTFNQYVMDNTDRAQLIQYMVKVSQWLSFAYVKEGVTQEIDTSISATFQILGYFDKILKILETIKDNDKPAFLKIAFDLHPLAVSIDFQDFFAELPVYIEEALTIYMANNIALKEKNIEFLNAESSFFKNENFSQYEVRFVTHNMYRQVKRAINQFDITKRSYDYIFKSSLKTAIKDYFKAIKINYEQAKRFAREKKRLERLEIKGKKSDWKVTPPQFIDLQALRLKILTIINNLIEDYQKMIVDHKKINYQTLTNEFINYMHKLAYNQYYHISNSIAKQKAIILMEEVGITDARKRFRQYPFQFSGGMRQRIVIAIALAANPDVLICDEPTTALDVTIQAQILELINKLKKERDLSIIFITHDLGVVANMADRIAVMYAGKIVEIGTADEIFYDPRHPYTWALLSSMPDLDTKEKLESIPGTPPNMISPPKGDAFALRNKYAMKIDFEQEPPFFEISPTHYAATWLLHEMAPKVTPPPAVVKRIERMKKLGEMNDGK